MGFLAELLVSALLIVGTVFIVVGSYGLVKLPDLMRRLHAPTKATTLGIGAMLIASMVYFAAVEGMPSIHELMITIFLFLTAPVTAYMLAKAQMLQDRPTRALLPPPGSGGGWATLDRTAPSVAGLRASEPMPGREPE